MITPIPVLKNWNLFLYRNDHYIYPIQRTCKEISFPFRKKRYKIREFYYKHFANLKYRIKQTSRYVKHAWYDKNGDFDWLIETLIFKLQLMENELQKGDRPHTVDQINIARECLDRVLENYHGQILYRDLKAKFPNIQQPLLTKRHCSLTTQGKKMVTIESSNTEYSKLYSEERDIVRKYYPKYQLADLRVAFNIIAPSKDYLGLLDWYD